MHTCWCQDHMQGPGNTKTKDLQQDSIAWKNLKEIVHVNRALSLQYAYRRWLACLRSKILQIRNSTADTKFDELHIGLANLTWSGASGRERGGCVVIPLSPELMVQCICDDHEGIVECCACPWMVTSKCLTKLCTTRQLKISVYLHCVYIQKLRT